MAVDTEQAVIKELFDRCPGEYRNNLLALATTGPLQQTTTLTNAQVKALRATPITVVDAPASNQTIMFLGAALICDSAAAAYTESTDNLAIRLVGTTGVIVSQDIESGGFVDAAAIIHTRALPKVDPLATVAQCVGKALVLHNTGDGELGGGNAANSMRVIVYYALADIA